MHLSDTQRTVIVTSGVVLFFTMFATASYLHHPTKIESASSLERSVGDRVELVAEYDGRVKPGWLIRFDETTLLVKTLPTGAVDRWPKDGEPILVEGHLEDNPHIGDAGVAKYVITRASWAFR